MLLIGLQSLRLSQLNFKIIKSQNQKFEYPIKAKMKILVIMKRFGANKDMVLKNFGRQIRLFENLAKEHQIDFLCPDYTNRENKTIKKNGLRFFIVPVSFF